MLYDLRLVLVLAALCVAVVVTAAAAPAAASQPRCTATPSLVQLECSGVAPVPSLQPKATEALWRALSRRKSPRRLATAQDCRPLRAVFYAATDWLRLATKLAAAASPCAQYYVSIPPLVSDKTRPRPDQAGRIRALGPNFHALAEIHMVTWGRWVTSTGSTWHQAGVEARRRMAAAGYEVARGDTWAVNELNSAVRRGDGAARANAREFLRGLYEGEATPAKGIAWIVGVGQRTPDVTAYKVNLQRWLEDAAFWSEIGTYVSDWSQEVYGDVRSYAVAGSPLDLRRDRLNEYLQHELALARAGPDVVAAARTFLQATYSPLANAAWQWDLGYGWTVVGADEMKDYVSAQIYSLRQSGTALGAAEDRWGFAWAPRNATAIPSGDFTLHTGLLLDRLAVAIRDSAETSTGGIGACGPPGQLVWCNRAIDGAAFTDVWRSFSTWTITALAFTTGAQTISAGGVSAPIAVQLQTSGVPTPTAADLPVTLSSSSPTGLFSTAATGPWASTLMITIPAGGTTAPSFYYQDTRAGSHVLTAIAPGVGPSTQGMTVVAGEPVTLTVTPAAPEPIPSGGQQAFTAGGTDVYGNPLTTVNAAWSVSPDTLGTVSPAAGTSTTFTAGPTAGAGSVTVTVATSTAVLTASAPVTVIQPKLRLASVAYRVAQRRLYVTVSVTDERGKPLRGVAVSIRLYRNGKHLNQARSLTATNGRAVFTRVLALARKTICYRTQVTRVVAPGFRWPGATPTNRFCRRPAKR
jgi:hypothetical protein